jgi:two-component system response regulator FlrC
LFEQAQGGTVFLDEIGEMPIHLQAKLLRVLQEKKLNRLGGEAAIDLDVRVIAATNKDLRQAIEAREFREDLYFRISTFRLRIQPLCERTGDILPLAMQALNRLAKENIPLSLSIESQLMLQQYPWPGNVRELENVIQRAVVLCRGRVVTPAHLMFDETQPMMLQPIADSHTMQAVHVAEPAAPSPDSFMVPNSSDDMKATAPEDLMSAVKASEHQVILAAIQATESRVEAAKKLGISPRTLRYKLAQLRERGMDLAVAA